MNVASPINAESSRKSRMLDGHNITAGIAHTLPGITYLLTVAKSISMPVLIQYGTLLVIAAQLTYWVFRIIDLVGHWWRRRRR